MYKLHSSVFNFHKNFINLPIHRKTLSKHASSNANCFLYVSSTDIKTVNCPTRRHAHSPTRFGGIRCFKGKNQEKSETCDWKSAAAGFSPGAGGYLYRRGREFSDLLCFMIMLHKLCYCMEMSSFKQNKSKIIKTKHKVTISLRLNIKVWPVQSDNRLAI